MKMKYIVSLIATIGLGAAAFANEQALRSAWDFVAPSVIDPQPTDPAPLGTIVYDAGTNELKGAIRGATDLTWASLSYANSLTVNTTAITSSDTINVTDAVIYSIYRTNPTSSSIDLTIGTGFSVGKKFTIVNEGTQTVVLKSADTSAIRTVYPGTSADIVCAVDADSGGCDDNADWQGLGVVMSDWTEDTSASGTWTSAATYAQEWRRVGDTLEVRVRVTYGGSAESGVLSLTLPNSFTIDTNKLPSTSDEFKLGSGVAREISVKSVGVSVKYKDTDEVTLQTQAIGSSYVELISLNTTVPFTFASGDYVEATYSVPVSGWTTTGG